MRELICVIVYRPRWVGFRPWGGLTNKYRGLYLKIAVGFNLCPRIAHSLAGALSIKLMTFQKGNKWRFQKGTNNPNWKGGISLDNKKYYESRKDYNREYNKEYLKEYRKLNREKLLEKNRKYNKVHSKERIEYNREWRKNHKDKYRHQKRIRKAREKGAIGSYSLEEWKGLKKKYNYTCPCCGRKEPEIELVADHMVSLKKGGENTIDNIQPLCRACNSRKYVKCIKYVFGAMAESLR